MASENMQTVELRRSVRYGRLIIGGAVVGALVASLITVLRPIPEGAEYTLGQITGFMLLIGGAVGLGIGCLFALVLTMVAKRQHGTGTVVAVEEPEDEAVESAAEVGDAVAADEGAPAETGSDAEDAQAEDNDLR